MVILRTVSPNVGGGAVPITTEHRLCITPNIGGREPDGRPAGGQVQYSWGKDHLPTVVFSILSSVDSVSCVGWVVI